MKTTVCKLVTAAFLFATAGAVFAQNPGAAPPPEAPPAAQQAQSIDDATVDKFATAYGEVVSLQEGFVEELNALGNDEDSQSQAQELQMQAQEEMAKAVQDAGLSIDEYNNVVVAMDSDPELKEKIMSKVDK